MRLDIAKLSRSDATHRQRSVDDVCDLPHRRRTGSQAPKHDIFKDHGLCCLSASEQTALIARWHPTGGYLQYASRAKEIVGHRFEGLRPYGEFSRIVHYVLQRTVESARLC